MAPTVGNSAVNPICRNSPTTLSGWYQCDSTMTGNHITIRKTGSSSDKYFLVIEMLAYTEFAV